VTATVVVLSSPLLFPFALLLHVVVRPRIPIAERRLARLRESTLESDVDLPACPACHRPVDPTWLLCPQCRATLAHLWCGATFDPPTRSLRTAR
jgi:hypothetical protein